MAKSWFLSQVAAIEVGVSKQAEAMMAKVTPRHRQNAVMAYTLKASLSHPRIPSIMFVASDAMPRRDRLKSRHNSNVRVVSALLLKVGRSPRRG
jgi:2-C-methyl-D-erythritol 4-phosphate cytidylyltransferase